MDWSKAISIDKSWYTNVLNHQFTESKDKITVCLHSVSSSGTQVTADALVTKLHRLMPEFVLGKKRMGEFSNSMDISFHSTQYFGNVNPEKDGKYGELLLFALVEAFLDCKMVAHKVRALSSMNDQVKGGDGVFLGNYRTKQGVTPSYLVGESKVVKNFRLGLEDAFKSIYRMHAPETSHLFREAEWVVALDNMSPDDIDVDELYNRLDPTTRDFQEQNLVHPILIMYNSGVINRCEQQCMTKQELEAMLVEKLKIFGDQMIDEINEKLNNYPEIKAVHLHFFMIPFNNVSAFRNAMYARIHNAEYRPKPRSKPKSKS